MVGNEDRKLAIEMATERIGRAADFWEEKYYRRLRDFDDYYHVRLPEVLERQLQDDSRSNLVPPDIHLLTNDFRANIVRLFYRSRKIARLLGRGPSDVRNENFAQHLFDWNLQATDRWKELDKDAHSIAVKGFSVTMLELKPVSHRFVDKSGHLQEEEMFGGKPLPHSVHMEALRFFPDPAARSLRWPECRFVGYQVDMTKEAMYHAKAKDPKHWIFTDDEIRAAWGGMSSDEQRANKAMRKDLQNYYEAHPAGNDVLQVDYYIGDFTHPNRPTDFRQAIVGVLGQNLVYFNDDGAPAPLVDFFTIMGINTEDDRLLSMGKVEAIEDSYLELYTKRNQSVEMANLGGYGMTFIQRGHGLPEAHRVGPYTWVEIDNPLDMKMVNPTPNTALAVEAGNARNELRDAYGSNYSLGMNPQDRESATGANILVEQQSVQNHAVVLQIWNSGLARECKLRFQFLQMFSPDEVWVRISEDKLRPMQRLTKEQIVGDFDYELAVGLDDFMPEAVRQARMERMVAMYRGDPDVDQLELKRRHFNVMGMNDAELLIVGVDEKEGWARAENTTILQYGIKMPLWGGEDHMIHARIHMMGIISAIDLARQNLVRAENIEALQAHFELHQIELQAVQGIEGNTDSVLPRGNGGIGQARADLGPALGGSNGGGPTNRISATRASAASTAHQRGVFE